MNTADIMATIFHVLLIVAIALLVFSFNLRISARLLSKFWPMWSVAIKKIIILTLIHLVLGAFFGIVGSVLVGTGFEILKAVYLIFMFLVGGVIFGSMVNPITSQAIGVGKGCLISISNSALFIAEILTLSLLFGLPSLIAKVMA